MACVLPYAHYVASLKQAEQFFVQSIIIKRSQTCTNRAQLITIFNCHKSYLFISEATNTFITHYVLKIRSDPKMYISD